MSANIPQDQAEQEIDLSQVSKKIGDFFQKWNMLLFKSIRFFVKNAITLVILLVVGVSVSVFFDKTKL